MSYDLIVELLMVSGLFNCFFFFSGKLNHVLLIINQSQNSKEMIITVGDS